MTHDEFNAFIDHYKLHSFDGLIEVVQKDGSSHRAVWITGTVPLDPSVDGKFPGLKDEYEIFYLFDHKKFEVWHPDEIEKLVCIQQNYLKPGSGKD